jgi:hypothetical protein
MKAAARLILAGALLLPLAHGCHKEDDDIAVRWFTIFAAVVGLVGFGVGRGGPLTPGTSPQRGEGEKSRPLFPTGRAGKSKPFSSMGDGGTTKRSGPAVRSRSTSCTGCTGRGQEGDWRSWAGCDFGSKRHGALPKGPLPCDNSV